MQILVEFTLKNMSSESISSRPQAQLETHAPLKQSRRSVLAWLAASAGTTPWLAACGGGGGSGNPGEARWAADFQDLSTNLKATHPDPTGVLSSAAWASAVERALSNASGRSFNENLLETAKLLALFGDPHTALSNVQQRFAAVPARFSWIADNVHVSAAAAESQLGAKVVAIDGMPTLAVIDKIALMQGFYNLAGKQAGAPRLMCFPELLQLLGVAKVKEAVTYTLQHEDGIVRSVQLSAEGAPTQLVSLSGKSLPLWQSRSGVNYWSSLVAGDTAVYLRYLVCRDDPTRPFSTEIGALADALGKMQTPRLIVDVRGNPGGNSAVFTNALAAATGRFAAMPRVAVLLDRDTLSSGLFAVADVKRFLPASRSFGQASGQSPRHPGDAISRQLPHSGLSYQMSTKTFDLPLGSNPETYTPDAVIEPSLQDVMTGRDRVLEEAVAWLKQAQ